METALERLIRQYSTPGSPPISLRHLEDVLRQARFNGAITYHYRSGIAVQAETGKPIRVALAQESLDKCG
jgi:hypothetical protein